MGCSSAWQPGIFLFKKPRRVCRPQAAKQVQSVFCGGVYVAKNSSQSASVEFVRFQRTNYACGRLQAFCPKSALPFWGRLRAALPGSAALVMYSVDLLVAQVLVDGLGAQLACAHGQDHGGSTSKLRRRRESSTATRGVRSRTSCSSRSRKAIRSPVPPIRSMPRVFASSVWVWT